MLKQDITAGHPFILTDCEILSDSGTVQLSGLYLLAIVAIGVLRKGIF